MYPIIGAYFAVLLGLGWLAGRRVRSQRDFLVADQSLRYWVAAFSTQATGESAWLLLGLTGMGAMVGVSAYWVVVGELIGVGAAWFLMGRRFKRLTERYQSLTLIDYLVSRTRARGASLRLLAASALTVFVVIYISAQIDATGSAFEQFLGWDYHLGAVVGFVIVVIYCVIGGFLAVAWTDTFQGVVMLLGLLMLPLVAVASIEGNLWQALAVIDPGLVNVWGSGGFSLVNLMAVLGMALIGLGFLGSPQIFARFIAVRDEQQIMQGRWVAVAFTLLVDAAAVTVGLLGRVLLGDTGPVEDSLGNGAQNVLAELVRLVFPLAIVGVYVAAVLAAIMSTVSSLLIMATASVAHDIGWGVLARRVGPHTSRWITVLLAAIALAVAMTVAWLVPERTIFWFVIFGWAGIAATFCPLVILSLCWSGLTREGAFAAMLGGFLGIPLFKFGAPYWGEWGSYFVALDALPPAFLLSLLCAWLVSLCTADPELRAAYRQDLQDLRRASS